MVRPNSAGRTGAPHSHVALAFIELIRPDLFLLWPATWVWRILYGPAPGVQVLAHEEAGGKGKLIVREKGFQLSEGQEAVFWDDFDRESDVEWDTARNRLRGLKRWVYDHGQRRLFWSWVEIFSIGQP